MLSERSTIWATSPLRKRGANAISNLPSVNAIVERSSFAYCSKIGFVDAGHQSMFFSHGNRLPFRLTCLAGGVQRSCLCHTDVFDSLISRMFPSTSFWGKPWRFAAPIAFSASSVLFQMFTFAYWTYVSVSFFWSIKRVSRCSFFDFRAPLKSWRFGASIVVPLASSASALPSELQPRWRNGELMPYQTFPLLGQKLNRVFYCISL